MTDFETKTKLFNLYIENLKTTMQVIDDIIPVVKSFDGKCYNARFDNAINQAVEKKYNCRVYVEDFDYKRCYIEVCYWNKRSVSGNCCAYYFPSSYEKITACNIYSDYNTWDTSKNDSFHYPSSEHHFYIDENYKTRVCSDFIVKSLEEKREDLQEKIEHLTGQENKVREYETKLESIKKELETLAHSIPMEVKDFFEIKTYANYY